MGRWLTVMPCSRRRFAGFVDDAVGGAPADEGDVGGGGAAELRRGDGGGDAVHLAHALFHHGAALGVVGVGVGDEDAVFVVLVAGDDVGVAGDAGDDARGDAAFGDLVAEVLSVRGRRRRCEVMSSPRSIGGLKSRRSGSTLRRPSERRRSQRTMPGHWKRSVMLKISGMRVKQSAMSRGAAMTRG